MATRVEWIRGRILLLMPSVVGWGPVPRRGDGALGSGARPRGVPETLGAALAGFTRWRMCLAALTKSAHPGARSAGESGTPRDKQHARDAVEVI